MLSVNELSKAVSGSWYTEPSDRIRPMAVETDSRKKCKKVLFVAFSGENFDAHNFLEDVIDKGAAVVCIEKHPSESTIMMAEEKGCGILKVKSTVTAYQEMGTYVLNRNKNCKVIGITGSSGKTSTKAIMASLLESRFPEKVLSTLGNTNNHIGVPQNLLRLKGSEEFAVIEMGTNHPGEIEILAECASPDVAIITSIGDSHSGNFKAKGGILDEKADIIRFMKPGATAVIPFSQLENLQKIGALAGKKFLTFGTDEKADFQVIYHGGNFEGSTFTVRMKSGKLKEFQSSLTGRHQAENCTAALAALKVMGFKIRDFQEAVKNLSLPGMRMKVSEVSGVQFINDAYNANPQSMLAFFDWLKELDVTEKFSGKKYLVVGDMLELGKRSLEFHEEVFKSVPPGWDLIAVGEFGCALIKDGPAFPNSKKAGDYLKTVLKKGDAVALKGSRGLKLEKIIENLNNKGN